MKQERRDYARVISRAGEGREQRPREWNEEEVVARGRRRKGSSRDAGGGYKKLESSETESRTKDV